MNMKFIEAIKKAEDGYKIRRNCWANNEYVYLKFYDELVAVTINGNGFDTIEKYIATTSSILAQDWEIYVEEEEEEEII